MNIECLPLELLVSIICKLPGRELGNVARTCKKFRETTLIDSVWQLKCKEVQRIFYRFLKYQEFAPVLDNKDVTQFGVCGEALEGSTVRSFRVLYTQILHPHGYLLGVWQPQMNHYGGLVKIQLVEGGLTASQYLVPVDPEVYLPLGVKKIFEIRLSDEALVKIECLKGQNGGHKLQINKNDDDEFTMKCCMPDKHESLDRRRGNCQDQRNETLEELDLDVVEVDLDEEELDRDEEELGRDEEELGRDEEELDRDEEELDRDEEELTAYCRNCDLHELNCIYTYKRLPRPMPSSAMPIRPGLFKGTYGGHGIEIICLTYEGNRLKGIKVTGDPNVPATKVSMDVHLDEPMLLKASHQESLHTVAQLHKEEVRTPPDLPLSQPFVLPPEVSDRGMFALGWQTGIDLTRCTHRYFASGLIAMTNFTDPSRTPAHFIVFSEDVLGFLWLELQCISIYSRVTEKFWT